jgi:hypothetical protein
VTKGFLQGGNPLDASLPTDESGSMTLDTYYVPYEDVSLPGEQNDIGYNIDAKNGIVGSYNIYVGDPIVETIPGCGRMGMLDLSSGDPSDHLQNVFLAVDQCANDFR